MIETHFRLQQLFSLFLDVGIDIFHAGMIVEAILGNLPIPNCDSCVQKLRDRVHLELEFSMHDVTSLDLAAAVPVTKDNAAN